MTPGRLSRRVIADRLEWIERMLAALRTLPLESEQAFFADPHNVAAAESYLRRALEALLDLGRHILAKGFGEGVSEYKEIARGLHRQDVLDDAAAELLETMAGYRNRMVHFYHEIAAQELYQICAHRLEDVAYVTREVRRWVREHPELMDDSL
jgi:uncharacterized protein YutE (UPF0331/DUF86 family)